MEERFRLDPERLVRAQDPRQQLEARLDRAFRPAVLLRLERVHLDRDFGRGHDVGQEHEAPAGQLRPVAQDRDPR